MISPVENFLAGLDSAWGGAQQGKRIPLKIIGATALMLQTDYARITKDSDVLETIDLQGGIVERLTKLAGEDTDLHKKHRIYIDVVRNGIPFLPSPYLSHPLVELNERLRWFEIHVLAVEDVVVTKLKRFNARDISDIKAMVERGLVDSDSLVAKFKTAADRFQGDARAEKLEQYLHNLNTVLREYFFEMEIRIRFD